MTLHTDLMEKLRSLGIERVSYAKAPQGYRGAYVVIYQGASGDDDERGFDDGDARDYQESESFDVECCSDDAAEAVQLGNLVTHLDHYAGPLGTGSCKGIFARDKSGDYIPRQAGEDQARQVVSLDLEILGYAEA